MKRRELSKKLGPCSIIVGSIKSELLGHEIDYSKLEQNGKYESVLHLIINVCLLGHNVQGISYCALKLK